MIKFHEIKIGDYLIADNDGDKKQGKNELEDYPFILSQERIGLFFYMG